MHYTEVLVLEFIEYPHLVSAHLYLWASIDNIIHGTISVKTSENETVATRGNV